MKRWALLCLLFVPPLSSPLGCGGDGCLRNSDCNSDQVCRAGQCSAEVPPALVGDAGEAGQRSAGGETSLPTGGSTNAGSAGSPQAGSAGSSNVSGSSGGGQGGDGGEPSSGGAGEGGEHGDALAGAGGAAGAELGSGGAP